MRTLLLFLTLLAFLLPTQILARGTSLLQPDIPENIAKTEGQSTHKEWPQKHQKKVNQHAWRTFTALMWPALREHRGLPHIQGKFGTNVTRVWETWKEQYEVYPEDGTAPAAWNTPETLPTACQSDTGQPIRYLYRNEKIDDVLDAVNQAVKTDATLPGTLTDQYGKVVRYEIRMNKTVFDYIVKEQLYNGEKQAQADNIDFPDGSILVKAAWRELTSATSKKQRKNFMTRQACICDSADTDCYRAEVALVGFHIMHKTKSAPQWIWSTFEHKANVRRNRGVPASFHTSNCQGDYCTPNSQTPTGTPNQVTRELPSTQALRNINRKMHRRYKKYHSVLQHYRLMSAQWPLPTSTTPEKPTVFHAQPPFSANTTMETFAQKTSSCMGCHVMSRTMKPDQFVSGDFSFTLNNAHPKPAGAVCDSYSYSNSIGCSDETILFNPKDLASYPIAQAKQITQGHQLTSHTYEKLPTHVGNKLHCRSCHLHAGGVPEASWWVNMRAAYTSDNSDLQKSSPAAALQGRINQCFERSMNGKALCTTASVDTNGKINPGNCDTDNNMSAIVAYMDWLTDTYNKKHDCDKADVTCNPARGFPPLTKEGVIGDRRTGKHVFQQKCAFCHDKEGQGRYTSNTYFRPALWGDASFPSVAGMAKPEKLAQFLRWNMPYGSGGLLTDKEAQDIACYIDAQKRPGKTNKRNSDSSECAPEGLEQQGN
jgi:cytochrome c